MQFYRFIHAVVLFGFALIAQAEEVTIPYRGLTLSADLELATGKQLADGVMIIAHGGLAHRDMQTIGYLQGLFKDRGYNTLAINLSLGLNHRLGMYDCQVTHRHRHADASDEIGAWLAWLAEQGARDVTLLGHSRGAGQTALFVAEHNNALIKAAVLLAPQTRENGGAGYERRYGKSIQPLLQQAEQLIREGKGDTVLSDVNLMFCRDTAATADAFVSYYGPDPRLDTPSLIPHLKVPTLVVVAGADEVVVGLEQKVAPLVDGKRIRMSVIEDADHFFRDLNADDAVDVIDAFLANVAQ